MSTQKVVKQEKVEKKPEKKAGKKAGKKPARKPRRVYTAKEKCEAVLAIWTERRKPSEICKEMSVVWAQVNQWEDQALRGMISALEPRHRKESEKPPALTGKLKKLLEKMEKKEQKRLSRLEQRLEEMTEKKTDSALKSEPLSPSGC